MFVAHAIAWSTLGLVIVVLSRHAWTLREDLQLSRDERIELRGDIATWSLIPLAGLMSLAVIALCVLAGRPQLGGLWGFMYSLMSLSGVVGGWARLRAARELP